MASPEFPAAPPPQLDQLLCFRMYATSLKMTQLYKPMLAELNLTYPQFLVMVVLWQQDGLGIKDVAERLGQDSGSVTPLVKRLEAEGYLLRSRDPHDERHRVLTLTEAGQRLRAAGARIDQQFRHACAVTPDDYHAMMAAMAKLGRQLST